MVAHLHPPIDRSPGFLSQCSQSSHKISSIRLVIDNPPLFNASNHHVVQGPWTIESCLPRHNFLPQIPSPYQFVHLVNGVPLALLLQVDYGGFNGFLFLASQPPKAVHERIGDAEFHDLNGEIRMKTA